MRPILALCLTCLFGSVAHAQLMTLQQMMQGAIAQCIAGRPGQADAPRFCTCWVHRWVGLWDARDRVVWTRTAIPTRHMVEMESVAAAQCGG
jgi:hypothetical protein